MDQQHLQEECTQAKVEYIQQGANSLNKEEMLINSISTICEGNFPKQTNLFNGFLIFRKVR